MEFMQQDIKLLLFLLFTTKPCFNVKRKCTPNVQSNVEISTPEVTCTSPCQAKRRVMLLLF